MSLDAPTRAWLRLVSTPGVDRGSIRRLLTAFGDPVAVCEASEASLTPIVGSKTAKAVCHGWRLLGEVATQREDALADWLGSSPAGIQRRLIPLGDPLYPSRWLAQADPPVAVFACGQLEPGAAAELAATSERLALAVVGSRHATPQGLDTARAFARHLGQAGWTIVSGLALGIDGAAHEAALGTAGGTVAIVGTGIDIVYPPRHRKLHEAIQREGVIFSEYAPGTPPLAHQFPERNRLIAALSQGTLVVEAALQSGSLITARLANEMGREVFAIPGSIHSPQSRGCHALIKQGAKLVESAADIEEELGGLAPSSVKARGAARSPQGRADDVPNDSFNGSPNDGAQTLAEDGHDAGASSDHPLLKTLGWSPMTLDELCARTGESAATLSARLLELELNGLIRRLSGQRYERLSRG